MTNSGVIPDVLITFGGLFLIGLLADLIGRHTMLPRVTLLLLAGFLIGPSMLDILPAFTDQWFPVLTDISLAMIGFLLGQNMTNEKFNELGRTVIVTSIGEVVMTAILIFTVLVLFGVPVQIALLLAGIAPATAPAATMDVINEYQAKGKYSNTLLGIVAIDDAWGLLVFSLLLAVAQAVSGQAGAMDIMLSGLWELFGALLLGLLIGLPMAYLTGRISPGEPSQAEAIGMVMLVAGIAELIEVSYILSAMVLGAVVANLAKHHKRPFNAIEGIEWPFLILFFLLAGAALHVDALAEAGFLVVAYIGLRIAGRIIGTRLGGRLSGMDKEIRHWIGLSLLPQAGVAIGMALLASQRFPEVKNIILPAVLGSTVIFEVIGPIVTRWTLVRVGDIQANTGSRS